ncbi:hypothetical protein GOP47_0012511 [Adiantum capillus-veneris]|uniref:Uncharacterized protein n=1 Tax=Adiantum capillus-veneris TaxID=13818 RepID=A0A9D4UQU4_ADICA|nr:hypothetical protein GOP47_0012511 [Adiantum capillus-veneris]
MRLLVLRLQKVVQKHLTLLCFKLLKAFAVSNTLKRRKQEAVRNFTLKSQKKRCFNAWITLYKLEHKRHEAVLKLYGMENKLNPVLFYKPVSRVQCHLPNSIRRRMCRELFCLWQKQTQQQIHNQRKLLIAERFWSLSIISTYFMHWQLGLGILQRKKHLNRVALGFWAHRRLSMSLLALKKAVVLQRTFLIMTAKRNRRLLESLFKHWHSITIEDLKELHQQALCASNKSLVLKSFRTLRNFLLRKNSSKWVNRIALCFHHDQCMYCTYKAWHDYVTLRHDKQRLKAAALTHLKRKLMRSVLTKWHLYTQSNERQESLSRVYDKKLCSRCIQIWKEHMLLSRRAQSCMNTDENEALCILSHIVALLQSQNRLLRRGFLRIMRNKRLSAKRGIKILSISRACFLYRRCIQELASAARNYIENSKERRCHICTAHVSYNDEKVERVARPAEQVLASTCDVTAGEQKFLHPNEDKNDLALLADPTMQTAEKEESAFFKAVSALPDSHNGLKALSDKLPRTREAKSVLGSYRGRPPRKTRLPPRRPLYLSHPFALERRVSDTKLIREELIWTEDLLSSFDKLKAELHQREAELAALHERHNSGDKLHADKFRFLQEKIMILHERQSILLPMVQGLASRAEALQRSFCKGTQILHLD